MAELDVAQSHILERPQESHDAGLPVGCEELDGLVDGHVEHIIHILSPEGDFQYVLLEALAMATLAGKHQVGHKLHLNGHGAFSLSLLTAASFGIEAEASGRVAHLLGQRLCGKEAAYLIPGLHVSYGVGA